MDVFDKAYAFPPPKVKELFDTGIYPYFRTVQSMAGPEVKIDGRRMLMLGSNNYLGLTQHSLVIKASQEAAWDYGSGCTGSRFLNGNLAIHQKLEDRLAQFMGKEACILFSTGYQANVGALSCLAAREDAVLLDRANHASLIDGAKLSGAEIIRYKHNDMNDLEARLKERSPKPVWTSTEYRTDKKDVLVATDGVFSMEGDVCDLGGIIKLKKEHNLRIYLDDAHGIGVLGFNGRGTAEYLGFEREVDLVMGTFSKSLASMGGFVVGERKVVDYIKHTARSLVFSASMPPSNAAAALAALDIIETDIKLRHDLWEHSTWMKEALLNIGCDVGNTCTPIIPVIVGDPKKTWMAWQELFNQGIYVNAIIPPASEPNRSLLRISVMATHKREDLEKAVRTIETMGKKLKILNSPILSEF